MKRAAGQGLQYGRNVSGLDVRDNHVALFLSQLPVVCLACQDLEALVQVGVVARVTARKGRIFLSICLGV